jgi:tRNA-uridine 2-sulfurtransferase
VTTATGLSPLEDHLAAPRGRGALAHSAHSGAAGGAACGDLIRVALRIEGARVVEAGFDARGCGAAQAAGSAVVELVHHRPALDAARLGPDDISDALGGLSPSKRHAATLAADALHRALGAAAADQALTLASNACRTLVAMSGGVDSSVAAQLATEAGHEVIGVTVELWSDPENDGDKSCCSPQAVTGARALAHSLGLPHITLDLREQFRAQVVEDFVKEHAAGRTPNPCVRCNGLVRFDEMLQLAGCLGAERLATGHYARITQDDAGALLRCAADPAKDQSYMLARLGPEKLGRLWFPLGELEKPRVRGLARDAGLTVADRRESQDLCFLAGTRQVDFLRRHAAGALDSAGRPGDVVDASGQVLGRHQGQHEFTVGQRRGLGISAAEPQYVLKKDPERARVTIGPRAALRADRVHLRGARLERAAARARAVKLRYRSRPIACRVTGAPEGGSGALTLHLATPAAGVAPGQTAVLYDGDVVIGTGTIDRGEAARAA